jgi:uncharacterized membrane protein
MEPIDTKPWYASRAVIGGVLAVAAGIAGMLGYTISPADQASIIDLVAGLAASVGGVLAVIGRVAATRRIG